jgi:hypothetical protein
MKKITLAVLALSLLASIALTSCKKAEQPKPAEPVAPAADAVKDAAEATKDAAGTVKDAVKDAAKKAPVKK